MPLPSGQIAPAQLVSDAARQPFFQTEWPVPRRSDVEIAKPLSLQKSAPLGTLLDPPDVAMSNYQFEHDNGGFSDAIVWWDFNFVGEFEWREGNSGGFTTVPGEWHVDHPIATSLGDDYELGLKSSTIVSGTGVVPLYFQGSPMSPGDWRQFNSTALHSVRKTSLFGLGTYVVDTVYQIRLIAGPGPVLVEFTIRATCIRS